MVKVPFQFKRITDAFDEASRARPCSSGSEHSTTEEDSAELYDLVNSFIERDERVDIKEEEENTSSSDLEDERLYKMKESLQSLLAVDYEEDELKISRETELACANIGMMGTNQGYKRQLMSRLRLTGLDAGLCKSEWKKIGHFPAGDYEYIDVVTTKTRCIIEISLSKQFTIARPTQYYQSLLDMFPQIYVGEADELKQVVRLMCAAAKHSLQNRDMDVPPWRKARFMVAKWFSSYKRTTNALTSKNQSYSGVAADGRRSVGFEIGNAIERVGYCRDGLDRKVGFRVGNLAQMLNG